VLDALGPEGELPVGTHDVDAEQDLGVHHVLGIRPQRGCRSLPGVAAVEEQGAGALLADSLDQGGQVREAAHLAVLAGELNEVQVGEGVGLRRAALDPVVLEEGLAHQVRRLAPHGADADVVARLQSV